MRGREKEIVALAVVSRVFCILLCLLTTSLITADFPRNSIVFGSDAGASVLYRYLSPFVQWDGNHFLNIAVNGYDSVLSHAFFPGLPLSIRILSSPFVQHVENSTTITALCGLFLVQCSFVLGSVGLYRLSLHFCDSEKFAFRATLFYIFASCSIFMSALYTESLFSMLTFWGLYHLLTRKNLLTATLFLSLASLFRSNGILAIAFLVHEVLSGNQASFTSLLAAGAIYLPNFLYSSWSWNLYCTQPEIHSWCPSYGSIYGYIQKHFWGVSFMSYWKLRNVGYFILMVPALIVAISAALAFVRHHWLLFKAKKTVCQWLIKLTLDRRVPFLAQMGVLTAFTVFIANCQILTRLLSSCPIYFWTIEKLTRDSNSLFARVLLVSHLAYYLIGPLVFSHGMNWT